jgi:RHS repeat-associated protein
MDEIEYYPFGDFRFGGPAPETTHLFTGHERELGAHSADLDYMHARYYSPRLGRFLSIDPVGGEAGSSQSWNRYTYVLDNPLKLIDPDGREYVGTPAARTDEDELLRKEIGDERFEIQRSVAEAVDRETTKVALELIGLLAVDAAITKGASSTARVSQYLASGQKLARIAAVASGSSTTLTGGNAADVVESGVAAYSFALGTGGALPPFFGGFAGSTYGQYVTSGEVDLGTAVWNGGIAWAGSGFAAGVGGAYGFSKSSEAAILAGYQALLGDPVLRLVRDVRD